MARPVRRGMKIGDVVTSVTFLVAMLSFFAVHNYVEPYYAILFLSLFSLALYCEYKKRFLPG